MLSTRLWVGRDDDSIGSEATLKRRQLKRRLIDAHFAVYCEVVEIDAHLNEGYVHTSS